jgi:hypothetical protein
MGVLAVVFVFVFVCLCGKGYIQIANKGVWRGGRKCETADTCPLHRSNRVSPPPLFLPSVSSGTCSRGHCTIRGTPSSFATPRSPTQAADTKA